MSSIYGFTGSNFELDQMEKALKHWEPDRSSKIEKDSFSGGCLELFKTPECIHNPTPFELDNLIVFFDGRIDNRDELALQLEIDNHQNKSDVVFAAEAFK